jgi:hypothetical protein
MSDVFHSSGIRVLENGACKVKHSSSTTNRGFYIITCFFKTEPALHVPISTFSPIQPAIPEETQNHIVLQNA